MGNSKSAFLSFSKMFRLKKTPVNFMNNNNVAGHEGIKTIETDKLCGSSQNSDICIRVVTWNMNGKVSYDDLVELVGGNMKYDLLVVGLQEVPKTNITQLLETAISKTHTLLGKATMQSLQLYVFGPKRSEMFIQELKVDKHAVGGWGGLIGRKKGAVAVCINYKRIRMVFISCHLSAHAKNVEERNSECRHISHSLFSKDKNTYERNANVTVWLGDLNYRIQGVSNHPVRSLIHKDLHSQMLVSKDQLLQEAEKGQIFEGYCEGTLTFKPTYKYNVGSSDYDTSHKVRVPAWTDRILFKVNQPDKIQACLRTYDSIDDVYGSDHKPVKAHLCLKLLNG